MGCEKERGTRLDKKRKQKQGGKMQLLPRKVAARSVTMRETERSVAIVKQEKRMALLRVDPPPVSE